jgi:hypothetical protein
MPIEPIKIPQNVYVEDRIIGPVTLKQLAIVGIGTGISYAMFATASRDGSISVPLGVALWTPALISAMFAFLKINDLSLFNLILLAIEHSNKPNTRYWSSHQGISINFVSKAFKQAVIDANTKINENANKLAELTRQMERREEELSKLANHMPTDVGEVTVSPATPRSRIDGIGIVPDSPQAKVIAPAAATEAPKAAVQPARVKAQGLNPAKSVDGFAPAGTVAAAEAAEDAQIEADFKAEMDANDSATETKTNASKKALDAFKHIFPQD